MKKYILFNTQENWQIVVDKINIYLNKEIEDNIDDVLEPEIKKNINYCENPNMSDTVYADESKIEILIPGKYILEISDKLQIDYPELMSELVSEFDILDNY